MEAGQKKKSGLGAGVSAPIFAIGCKVGCGLGRIDLLRGTEIVMVAVWGGLLRCREALKIHKNTQFRPKWV